ncbi:MAG: tannase/feruloyl esterase family alpha/beta hydrolase [Bryobacteraceae bacterium]
MRNRYVLFFAAVLIPLVSASAAAASCESLTSAALPNATITSAQRVDAGKFVVPPPPANVAPFGGPTPKVDDLPAFCRVTATLKPSADSDIKAEFWMPLNNWNGRLQPTAGGVFLGMVNYNGLANILRTGAVTATSDNGHEGGSASFALGHPEKLKDFAERAGHETVADAKLLIKAFYEKPQALSLMNECGGGGRTAITEVQRYPDDLDIAMVGGLDTHSTHHVLGQMWVWQAMHKDEASVIPQSKFTIINKAALAACDAKDGAVDGLIQDPTKCKFDPAVIACKNGAGAECLTQPQVETARKIYSPVRNSRTGEYIIGPLMPGSELGWNQMGGAAPFPYSVEFFRYLTFKDPNWDYKTRPVNFDGDVALADAPDASIINANNPNLTRFLRRGGRLLLIGGWNDAAIAPSTNYDYYNAVVKTMGGKAKNSVRLFMVPGMGHCPGGNGPSTFDIDSIRMLDEWRATNKAPERLIAQHRSNGTPDRKVLVCAYPKIAVFSGKGSQDDPANFSCKISK